jgi:4-amino-4-deoxychorismate lyase
MRQLILMIAADNQMPVQETSITKDFVLDADELFVSNSIIDIWPIKALDNHSYPVGLITQKIMAKLAAYKVSDSSHDIT